MLINFIRIKDMFIQEIKSVVDPRYSDFHYQPSLFSDKLKLDNIWKGSP